MPRPATAEPQLPAFVHNQGLFSAHFLASRLPVPDWGDEALAVLETLKAKYEAAREIANSLNEAQTESEFIRPVLEVLGWHFIPQVPLTKGGKHNIPDYALFGDAAAKTKATKLQKQPEKFFPLALAIADAKYWGRTLDAESPDDARDTASNANPGFQIISYLVGSDVAWGILTNGQVWRLYAQRVRSRTTTFYEVNLEEALQSGDREAFRYFAFFFQRTAFQPDPATGQCFLDRVLAESADYAVQVQDELKELVFERVVPLLVQGFVGWRKAEEGRRAETPETLAALHQSTLTLLYRLLFLLYAEARDLLPVRDARGYYQHSLTHIRREGAERKDRGATLSERSTDFWDDLTNLVRIVAKGDPSLNVPIYNGGLFKDKAGNGEVPLSQLKIADAYLGEAIDLLARRDDKASGRRVFIDYRDLDVRHLGSIYEGLLEFQPRIAAEDLTVKKEKGQEVWAAAGRDSAQVRKGEVYLVNDKGQRKSTGSYYTPDYIVKYIVANTVGPILDECAARFDTVMKQAASVRRKLAREANPSVNRALQEQLARLEAEAVAALLDVKVCDPAMGSGHFLVEAVGYLTDRFASLLAQYPANPLIALIQRVRGQILDDLRAQGLAPDPAHLDDKHLLKRMVMKRCIYGVDLNRMAVELAKLSLWLDSFTVGAPLSFLDHHLKWGNSLIGTRAETVQSALAMVETNVRGVQEKKVSIGLQGDLFGGPFAGLLNATELMRQVSLLTDATFEEVEQSAEKYAGFESQMLPYKQLLDIWVSRHFGVTEAENFLRLYGNDALKAASGQDVPLAPEYRRALAQAQALQQSKRFFHWDLEFPEVFIDLARASWKENPGFDAVVGNPPYLFIISVPEDERSYFSSVFPTCDYRFDVYGLFVEQGLDVATRGGGLGYIIPHSILNNNSFEKLRGKLIEQTSHIQIIDFTDRVFAEAANEPMILLAQLKVEPSQVLPRLRSALISSGELPSVNHQLREYSASLVERLPGKPLLVRGEKWLARLLKNPKTDQLGKLMKATQGLRTGDNDRFLTTEPSSRAHKKVLAGADIYRYGYDWPHTFVLYDREKLDAPRDSVFWEADTKILVQEVRNVQLRLRVVACVDEDQFIGLNTTNAVVLKPEAEVSIYYVMAVISSRLMNEFFRCCFVDNHIATQYLEAIPIRRIAFTTPPARRAQLVKKVIGLAEQAVESGEFGAALGFVRERLAQNPEQADVMHDLLAYLARQMTDLNRAKQKETREFLKWLGSYTGLAVDEWKLKTIAQDYARNPWEEFQRALRANARAFTRDVEGRAAANKIQGEWEKSVGKLRPVLAQIEATDKLIDRVVYELYGLSEAEIKIVEAG